jgi:hypothetical protein
LTHVNALQSISLMNGRLTCFSWAMVMADYKEYVAWDAATRWFHWINAIAIIGLIGTGLAVLFDDTLGLSAAGKVMLSARIRLRFYQASLNNMWGTIRSRALALPSSSCFCSFRL